MLIHMLCCGVGWGVSKCLSLAGGFLVGIIIMEVLVFSAGKLF